MTQIGTYRIRLALDLTDHDNAECLVTNATPEIWRGIPTNVEVGLFNNETFVDDLTNIDGLTMEIYLNGARFGPVIIKKELTSGDLNGSLTENDWDGGAAANCHATFELDSDDTNLDVSQAVLNVQTYWFCFYATTTAPAQTIVVGSTAVIVHVNGAPNDSVIGFTGSNFRITEGGKLQVYNKDQSKYHDIYIQGSAGQERLVISEGEA